jgi:hypothetical protein
MDAMTRAADVAELGREYHATLLAMDAERVKTGGRPNHWNRLVDHLQEIHLQLRETPAGRAAITAFVADENVTVRQWSATFALGWEPESARAELERQANDPEGLTAFDAEMILEEFDAGRLDLDWLPKGGRLGR